jgi:hypothetical protein
MENMEEQLENKNNKRGVLQFLRSIHCRIAEEPPAAEAAIYYDCLIEGLMDPAPKEPSEVFDNKDGVSEEECKIMTSALAKVNSG